VRCSNDAREHPHAITLTPPSFTASRRPAFLRPQEDVRAPRRFDPMNPYQFDAGLSDANYSPADLRDPGGLWRKPEQDCLHDASDRRRLRRRGRQSMRSASPFGEVTGNDNINKRGGGADSVPRELWADSDHGNHQRERLLSGRERSQGGLTPHLFPRLPYSFSDGRSSDAGGDA
jgi:hypothetical protein